MSDNRAEPERSLSGAAAELPMALADLAFETRAGSVVTIAVTAHQLESVSGDERGLLWLCEGAGFSVQHRSTAPGRGDVCVTLQREVSLPDTVGPDMQLLVCGLNPSIHAAQMGVGFGRAGNRFWPAALACGLVTVDRDPVHALRHRGIGMTDLVKRSTRRADELDHHEYECGIERLDWLCQWLRPAAVCMVGLSGWRAAVDRRATTGWQDRRVGGRPVYVMPSTSGLNAHAQLPDLTAHLGTARAGN